MEQKKSGVLEAYKRLKMEYGSKERSFEWWERNASRPELGVVEIDTMAKKAKFRMENTPSVAFYEGLSYVDYGDDGTKKDPVDRIREITGASTVEAMKMVLEWEGADTGTLSVPYTAQLSVPAKEKEYKKPYSPSYIGRMIQNRVNMKERYIKVASGLFRGVGHREREEAERLLKIGFSPKGEYEREDRVFVPEFDSQGIAWGSYRYNRASDRKGLLRKNGRRVLFGAHLLKNYPRTVVFTEGHTDAINLIGKRVPAVTTGSATTKIGEHISLLAGRKVLLFPDLDIPGMKGATKKAIEIEIWNASCKPEDRIEYAVFWWADWMFSRKMWETIYIRGLNGGDKVLHLVSAIAAVKKEHILLNKDMLRTVQESIFEKTPYGGYLSFPKIDIRNWTVVHKNASRKEGYDFVDRLEEGDFESKIKF